MAGNGEFSGGSPASTVIHKAQEVERDVKHKLLPENVSASLQTDQDTTAVVGGIQEFSTVAGTFLSYAINHYEEMKDSESDWAELYERGIDAIGQVVERISNLSVNNLKVLGSFRGVLDYVLNASQKFKKTSTISKFLENRKQKEAIKESRRRLLGAEQALASALLLDLNKTPGKKNGKNAEMGCMPQIPPTYLPRTDIESEVTAKLTGGLQCAVLEGMNGTGKSALAASIVAQKGVKNHFEGGIYWLNIATRNASSREMCILVQQLHAMMLGNRADVLTGRQVNIEHTFDELASQIALVAKDRKCLVVLDNVSKHHDEWLASFMLLGVSLVVTTDAKCANFGGNSVGRWEIGPLDDPEAAKLVSRQVGTDVGDMNGIKGVLKQCMGHVLTLCMCGALIKHTMKSKSPEKAVREVSKNLEKKQKEKKDAVKVESDVETDERVQQVLVNLGRVLEVCLNVLSENDRRLYLMLGVIPSGCYAPREVLQGIWNCGTPDCAEKIELFSSLCLIRCKQCIDGGFKWGLHDVQLQHVQRLAMTDNSVIAIAKERQMATLCDRATFLRLYKEDVNALGRLWGAIGGVEAFEQFLKHNAGDLEEDISLVECVSQFLLKLGCFSKAADLCGHFLASLGDDVGEDAIQLMNTYGRILYFERRYEESGGVLREVLSLNRIFLGEEHPAVAASMSNLGLVFCEQGKSANAEEMFEAARTMYGKLNGHGSLHVARFLSSLAILFIKQGKYKQAASLFQQKVSCECKVLGKDHPKVSETIANLASVLHMESKLTESAKFHKQVLTMRKRALGEGHPKVGDALHKLGMVLFAQRNFEEAEKNLREALALRRTLLGKEHLKVAESLSILANVLYSQGKREEAEEVYKEGVFIQGKVFGEELEDVAPSFSALQNVENRDEVGRMRTGQPSRGLRSFRDRLERFSVSLSSLASRKEVQEKYVEPREMDEVRLYVKMELLWEERTDHCALLCENLVKTTAASGQQNGHVGSSKEPSHQSQFRSDDHPLVAISLNYVASVLHEQGEYEKAARMYRDALALYGTFLSKEHSDIMLSLIDLGRLMYERGSYEEVAGMYDEALTLARKMLGNDLQDLVDSLNHFGTLCYGQGKYKEAERLQKEALLVRRTLLGDRHVDVSESLHNLGNALRKQGKHGEAAKMYEEALALRSALLGRHHPRVAESMSGLANALNGLSEHDKAGKLHKKALLLHRRLLGNEHPIVATALDDLGVTLRNQGKSEQAVKLHEEALLLRRKVHGDEHVDVARSLDELGITLYKLGRQKEAAKLQEDALAMRRKLLGDEDLDVARSLHNLGITLYKRGRHLDAAKMHEEALSIRRKLLGNEHVDVAWSLTNLGVAMFEQGNYEEAANMHEAAVAMRRKLLGNRHLDLARSLNNLGISLYKLGRNREASKMHEEALFIRRKVLGNEHVDVGWSLNNLGVALFEQGKLEEATKMHEAALFTRRRLLGNEHVDVAWSLNNLGLTLSRQGKHQEAAKMHEAALFVRRKVLGNEHVDVAWSLTNLGDALYMQRSYEEAGKMHEEALGMRRKLLGNGHVDVVRSLNNLGITMHELGRHEEAANLHKEACSLTEELHGGGLE